MDLRLATNILGTKWDDVTTTPSLETFNADGALEDQGVTPLSTPLSKKLVVTLDSTVPYHGMAIPQKIEGIAILDRTTVAVANDNDFGVGSFTGTDADCELVDSGRESQILFLRLDQPL